MFIMSTLTELKLLVHEYPYNIIFTFLLAVLSYEFYEKKISLFKKRFKIKS